MDNNETDFNEEFSPDAELDEELDAFFAAIGETEAKNESGISILNLAKARQMYFIYKSLKHLMRGTGADVCYQIYSPFNNMGYVSAIGKRIVFNHPEWFVKIADLASNVEVYPKTDGTVQINFTVHGLTIPVDDEGEAK